MSLMSILAKGGWTMIAVAIALFIGIYFAIDRFIYYKRSQSPTDDLLKKAETVLLILTKNNRNDEAKEFITEASKDIDIKIIIDGLHKLKQKYLVIKG